VNKILKEWLSAKLVYGKVMNLTKMQLKKLRSKRKKGEKIKLNKRDCKKLKMTRKKLMNRRRFKMI